MLSKVKIRESSKEFNLGGKQFLLPRILEKGVAVSLAVMLVFGLLPLMAFASDQSDQLSPASQEGTALLSEDNSGGETFDQAPFATDGEEGLEGAEEPALTEEPALEEQEESSGIEGSAQAGIAPAQGAISPFAVTWTVTYILPSGAQQTEPVEDGYTAPFKSVNPSQFQRLTFRGWYTVPYPDNTMMPYEFSRPVTGNLTLYAICADTYLISFLDQQGTVIHTIEVAPHARIYRPSDRDVYDKITPPGGGQRLVGFYDRDDTANPPTIIDFDYARANKNLYLKPYFNLEYVVLFNSEGTQVQPQLVRYGQTATQPVSPTRPGYSFAGWLKDGVPFNFSTPIYADTQLFASWNPQQATYLVALWMEKPRMFDPPAMPTAGNNAHYNYVGSVQMQGLSGSLSNVNGSSPGIAGLWSSHDMLKYAQFQWADNRVIDGNGTTVINLYASRKVYTYTYNLGPTSPNRSMTVNGYTYYSNSGYQFQLPVKFEMDITYKFPVQGNSSVQFNGAGKIFGCWDFDFGPDGYNQHYASVWNTVDRFMLPANGSNTGSLVWRAFWDDSYPARYTYRYLAEALPGQVGRLDNSTQLNGKTYIVMEECNESFSAATVKSTLLQRTINGLKRLPQRFYDPCYYPPQPNYQYNWYDFWPYYYSSYTGFQRISGYTGSPGRDLTKISPPPTYLCFFYDREIYPLTFNMMAPPGEVYNVPANRNLMYQEPFTNYQPMTPPTRAGYTFQGWYRDSDYMVPFNWNDTMPQGGAGVFAKWQSTANTVRFFDGRGGILLDTQYAANGGFVVNKPTYYVPGQFYAGHGVFLGWAYDILPGVSAQFYFTTPINRSYDVYATWRTQGFKITYDLDGGSGTIPPPYGLPVDNNEYAFGTSFLVLNTNATKGGNQFYAWKCGTAIYYPGSIVAMDSLQSLTLVALYAPAYSLFEVRYHMNSPIGENTIITIRVPQSELTFPLAGEIFKSSNDSYRLIGWRNDALSTSVKQYEFGQIYSITSNDRIYGKDFYGVWISSVQPKISGNVFDDLDLNTLYSPNEGIAGQTVTLYKETFAGSNVYTPSATTTTGSNGYYEFLVAANTNYKVLFAKQYLGRGLTTKGNTAISSHANPATGYSDVIVVGSTSGTIDHRVNAGYTPPSPISGFKKQVYNGTSYVDSLTLTDPTQEIVYQISFTIPAYETGIASLEIRDELPTALRLSNYNVNTDVVVLIDGTAPVPAGTLSQNGQIISYTFAGDYSFVSSVPRTVTMTLKTRLVDPNGSYPTEPIKNKATLIVNGTPSEPSEPPV
ncbi:MAG: InlB B-repeat-containing protein, partial [Coriobacteriales bacterium]|nr:InlB B-repeat-containing protein [Coriobacteriales bacterium]